MDIPPSRERWFKARLDGEPSWHDASFWRARFAFIMDIDSLTLWWHTAKGSLRHQTLMACQSDVPLDDTNTTDRIRYIFDLPATVTTDNHAVLRHLCQQASIDHTLLTAFTKGDHNASFPPCGCKDFIV
eukprot:TRINITY_DN11336_c0_g5_i1.p2 TRINITY_DN11336_c0_g5~~TRINITY_DN11336_c0_g5_i1.p2  ORF type:complete len:129 (+),score=10.06 TRINITY_DN11336_c0_g5_i1:848-1234(+)